MAGQLTKELIVASHNINHDINQLLSSVGAPTIGHNDSEYEKAKSFVDFNDWLLTANDSQLSELANQFGLLPMVYTLSGINVSNVTLLQSSTHLNVDGYIRYIKYLLRFATQGNYQELKIGMNDIFTQPANNNFDMEYLTNSFISSVLSYFINTNSQITYEQSLARFLQLIHID